MRILVDTGAYDCANMGDVAMMQVSVARLKSFWPNASMEVITDNPQAVLSYCPGAKPVPARGRSSWFIDRNLLGHYHRWLAPSVSKNLVRLKRTLRIRQPRLTEQAIILKLKLIGVDCADFIAFMDSFRGADVVVACGMGGLTDHTRVNSTALLELLLDASRRGKLTAMFGQGLGPISDSELRTIASKALPSVNVLALREGRTALPLLDSLKVPRSNVLLTGDDAIERAYEERKDRPGAGIGLNVRAMPSSGVEADLVQRLRPVLHELADRYRAPLVPLPVARDHECTDARTIRQIFRGYNEQSDGGACLDTPLKVIREVRRCRVVITGSYHAGVFALAQGLPVVCLAKSPYFRNKLLGLSHQFGIGCEVLVADDPALEEKLATAVERAWQSAEEVRRPLLRAAEKQIDLSTTAYMKFRDLVVEKFAQAHSPATVYSLN